MDTILSYISNIGFEAIKNRLKDDLEKTAAKNKLNEFLETQEKLNFNCTREEEIDFGGLFEY